MGIKTIPILIALTAAMVVGCSGSPESEPEGMTYLELAKVVEVEKEKLAEMEQKLQETNERRRELIEYDVHDRLPENEKLASQWATLISEQRRIIADAELARDEAVKP